MRTVELNGLIAIVGGLVVAVVIFVPVAAFHYRQHGRFTFRDLLALVAVPVYGLALWTYTLLPLPDAADFVCRKAQLDPSRFLDDLRGVWDGSWRHLLGSQVFLQLVLNVAFFVPLGVILRLRYRRGVLWAAGLGFAISLAIETTQLTGVWGLYDCAYRLFDVNDLMTNTLGALVGSLLCIPLARRVRSDGAPAPTTATFGRRFVANVSDGLVMLFIGAAVALAWRAWQTQVDDIAPVSLNPLRLALIQWGSVFLVEGIVILGWGATIGELVVGVRTFATQRWWTLPARMVKLVTGVGAVCLLAVWDSPLSVPLLIAFVVATVVASAFTPGHRGLSNYIAGLHVRVIAPVGTPVGLAGADQRSTATRTPEPSTTDQTPATPTGERDDNGSDTVNP